MMRHDTIIALLVTLLFISGSSQVTITLRDLGFNDITIKGIGVESYSANFSLPFRGNIRVSVEMFFYKEDPNAYVQVTISLNNVSETQSLRTSPLLVTLNTIAKSLNILVIRVNKIGLGTLIIYANTTLVIETVNTEENTNIPTEHDNTLFKFLAPAALLTPLIIRFIQIKRRRSWEEEVLEEE